MKDIVKNNEFIQNHSFEHKIEQVEDNNSNNYTTEIEKVLKSVITRKIALNEVHEKKKSFRFDIGKVEFKNIESLKIHDNS